MDNHLGFYLTNDSNETIELPVNPAEITVKRESDDKSETVIKLGEVNLLGEDKLQDISIESSLPINPQEEHYVSALELLDSAQDYIDWIESARKLKKPIRLVISTTKISMKSTITSFEYGMKNGYDGEYIYTLSLKEFRPFEAKKIGAQQQPEKTVEERPSPPSKVGMGSTVIVNGQLYRDSQGNGPGQIEQNATRKISLVAPGSAYPYHVTTLDGGSRGWVKESDVRSA